MHGKIVRTPLSTGKKLTSAFDCLVDVQHAAVVMTMLPLLWLLLLLCVQVISIICVLVWLININHFSDPSHGSWIRVSGIHSAYDL